MPTWQGENGTCSMSAYTADEARDGEKIWAGWRPVRVELEWIEAAQTVLVEPPQTQHSESQQDSVQKPGIEFASFDNTCYSALRGFTINSGKSAGIQLAISGEVEETQPFYCEITFSTPRIRLFA